MSEPKSPAVLYVREPTYILMPDGEDMVSDVIILRDRHVRAPTVANYGISAAINHARRSTPYQQDQPLESITRDPVSNIQDKRSADQGRRTVPLQPQSHYAQLAPPSAEIVQLPAPTTQNTRGGFQNTVTDVPATRSAQSSGVASGSAPVAQRSKAPSKPKSREAQNASRRMHALQDTGETSARSRNHGTSPVAVRCEHKIRNLDEAIVWWASQGNSSILGPSAAVEAASGDLYVHKQGDGRVQVWIWSPSEDWQPVTAGHAHPALPGYVLRVLKNGEPRWITRHTMRTYLGRDRKRV
ncbi:hypothetical protein B0H21DRAFT_50140 [Amylocystis lapponica]|nr:hypothetical protein B0H21DRAFT_50140 [Amylocystis lapponica]